MEHNKAEQDPLSKLSEAVDTAFMLSDAVIDELSCTIIVFSNHALEMVINRNKQKYPGLRAEIARAICLEDNQERDQELERLAPIAHKQAISAQILKMCKQKLTESQSQQKTKNNNLSGTMKVINQINRASQV